MVQPILVRPAEGGYQLVAGQRRLLAATEAGLHEMPVRVIDLEDQQVFEIAIIENLQRQDLNAIEKGLAFRDYLNRFGVTHEELAERLGVERSTVTNFNYITCPYRRSVPNWLREPSEGFSTSSATKPRSSRQPAREFSGSSAARLPGRCRMPSITCARRRIV